MWPVRTATTDAPRAIVPAVTSFRSELMALAPDDFAAAAKVLGEEPSREDGRPTFWRRRR